MACVQDTGTGSGDIVGSAEGKLLDMLWSAVAERRDARRTALDSSHRSRALNERMHRAALAALEEAHAEQLAAIERDFRAELDQIEDKTLVASRKVDQDERILRAQASRMADEHEERIQQTLQQKLWLSESVFEAAVPALRKARTEAAAVLDGHLQRIGSIELQASRIATSYRQRLPEAPTAAPSAPLPTLDASFRAMEAATAGLAACRSGRLFRGPILVVPLMLTAAAGSILGATFAPPGLGRGIGAALGAGIGCTLVAVATAGLFVHARREVRRLGLELCAAAASARAQVASAREAMERDFDNREVAARRTRDTEAAAANAKYGPRLEQVARRLEELADAITRKVPHYRAKVLRQRAAKEAAAEALRDRRRSACEARRTAALADELARRDAVDAEIAERLEQELGESESRWNGARESASAGIRLLLDEDAGSPAPWGDASWQSWSPPTAPPAAVRLGSVQVRAQDVTGAESGDERTPLDGLGASGTFALPVALRASGRMSLVVSAPAARRAEGLALLQATVARLLCSLPPGKARFTFVDPVGLGQSFAGFMHLSDENPLLVNDRIWTDARHVEQRLADLTEHMETVIQKYLRNEYASLEDYNRQAGEIAEPFRFLVMADFPTNVSDGGARRLASILQSGARCGVHVLLLRDPKAPIPAALDEAAIAAAARQVRWVDAADGAPAGWSVDDGRLAALRMAADPPPDDAELRRITQRVGEAAKDASRVEVPFAVVAPRPEERWRASAGGRLRVPIGRSGANRLQHLVLGEGTCQHALVAGKTGSGKSSLLNALIVNAALWHAPSELELWLIDFKKGVEFKAYASGGMPHVRVVAVESDREFGLSVLQGLDDELRRRGELFRAAGVQSITDWRALGRPEPMPRSLLVVDEFQELFIEDDKVAQDSALLLDRLVRQGRAFGMHAVLGSQTLGGAYGIARSTMGQMGVRIALQCAEADSQLILSDDNSAARLLSRPGEAIYNDAGGRLEGNNPFQVVWLPDEERAARIREIAEGPRAPDGRPGAIIFEGNLPADPGRNGQLLQALEARPGRPADAPRLWLGDPVSIKEPTAALLARRSGSNLVVVGQSEESGPALLSMSLLSLAAQVPGGVRATVLEGLAPQGGGPGPLARAAAALGLGDAVHGPREADAAILELGEELARRLAPGAAAEPPHFLFVDGLHRFRSLRRNENDFSFDDSGPKSPDRVLALLLREGPSVGMHVVAWVDTVANLQRSVDRAALREFNWKVLFQMSANDSSTIVDSPAASRLGPHRAILSDDDGGTLEKFRPYPAPGDALLARAAAAQARTGP